MKIEPHWIDDTLKRHGISQEYGPLTHSDSFGNSYVTLMLGGIRTEGSSSMTFATSAQAACDGYAETLMKFLDGHRHIVWRTKPELDMTHHRNCDLWRVYSRLVCYRQRPRLIASMYG